MTTFAQLFKKYRLRAEFETLTQLADKLAEDGVIFEESLYSHWQKGTRIPKDREIVIKLIHLFVKRNAISTIGEVNEFLVSLNQGNISQEEINNLPLKLKKEPAFLAPQLPANHISRKSILNNAKSILFTNKLLLIHGAAGIGKTSLAIELAHSLKSRFTDGVLYYRTDTTSVLDILSYIAFTYNFEVNQIADLNARASYIRSALSSKKILYIFDNIEVGQEILQLLPNSSESAVILTSKNSNYSFVNNNSILHLESFSTHESFELFNKILDPSFVKKNKVQLVELLTIIGNSPLAIQIVSKFILLHKFTVLDVIDYIKKNSFLNELGYENGNLYISIDLSFKKLPLIYKKILISVSVFEGKDFPVEATAFIHNLDKIKAKKYINDLVSYSFVENSVEGRYRLHPFIHSYLGTQVKDKLLFKKASEYYIQYLQSLTKSFDNYRYVLLEQENITQIIEECYNLKFYKEMTLLYKEYTDYIFCLAKWDYLIELSLKAYESAGKIKNIPLKAYIGIKNLSLLYSFIGDIKMSLKYTTESYNLAKKINNAFLMAFAKERLGKMNMSLNRIDEAEENLKDAIQYFNKDQKPDRTGTIYRHMAEVNIIKGEYIIAEKYLKKALKISSDETWLDSMYKVINKAAVLQAIALIHYHNKKYKQAFTVLNESLELQKKSYLMSTYRIWTIIFYGLMLEHFHDELKAKKFYREVEDVLQYSGVKQLITKYPSYIVLLNSLKKSKLVNNSTLLRSYLKINN